MTSQTVSATVVTVMMLLINYLYNDQTLHVVGQMVPGTDFSFPSFPVDSLLKSANAVYNSSVPAYDMTTLNTSLINCNCNISADLCGMIVYKDKVRMVDKASGQVASFNTSFTFSFHSPPETASSDFCGFGMVFTFAASLDIRIKSANAFSLQSNIGDVGMCTFDLEDKSPTNRVFAVKFDSFQSYNDKQGQYVDPSDGTIGVVISNKGYSTMTQYNLCGKNVRQCWFFCGEKGDFSAWIDYDSASHTIEVRFRNGSLASGGKPPQAVLSVADVVLDEVLDEEMYVGFTSNSIADFFVGPIPYISETHRISAWSFNSSGWLNTAPSSPPLPLQISERASQAGLIGGISAALVAAALMGLLCIFYYCKHRTLKLHENPAHLSTSTLTLDFNVRPYSFKELISITKSFSDSELLSSGAFGDVFKGTPRSGGSLVAVKRIKHGQTHGQASFVAEVNSLRQIRHRNLLPLRGWCEAKEGLFLVYDFMSNGSLDKWLHANPKSGNRAVAAFEGLSWGVRRSILAGVASALEYLHEDFEQCILHRDIKSSNVMLDENFNPYLGDFGLARLVDHNKRQKTTLLAGTLGYMAPEMHFTGRATKETDVYAFGMLVLEVVCARTPFLAHTSQFGDQAGDFLLLERVWRAHEEGDISNVVDPRLLEDVGDISVSSMTGYECGQLEMIAESLELGLLCCLPNPSERPSMRMVNQWFQSREAGLAMEFPCLPATKPVVPGQYTISVVKYSEETMSSQPSDATRLSAR